MCALAGWDSRVEQCTTCATHALKQTLNRAGAHSWRRPTFIASHSRDDCANEHLARKESAIMQPTITGSNRTGAAINPQAVELMMEAVEELSPPVPVNTRLMD